LKQTKEAQLLCLYLATRGFWKRKSYFDWIQPIQLFSCRNKDDNEVVMKWRKGIGNNIYGKWFSRGRGDQNIDKLHLFGWILRKDIGNDLL
jgi:hypothetical protein